MTKELCDALGFDKKAQLLADHLLGGEPLAVFNPTGGVTAAYINPALTWFNTAAGTGQAYLEGAYLVTKPLLSKYNPLNLLSIGGQLSY